MGQKLFGQIKVGSLFVVVGEDGQVVEKISEIHGRDVLLFEERTNTYTRGSGATVEYKPGQIVQPIVMGIKG